MRTAASAPYAARAIVLRTRPLGEKDRVLELFGPGIGRWSAVARGSRGAKSKLAALSQPFVLARLLLARGKTFDVLTQGEIESSHFHIPTHLLGAAWGSYWCEMLCALPERHAEDDIFALLASSLAFLDALCADAKTDAEAARDFSKGQEAQDPSAQFESKMSLLGHWFEVRFLALLGFPSVIGTCARCEQKIVVAPEQGHERIAFSPSMGGTLCSPCASADPERLSPRAHTLRLLHRLERIEEPARLPLEATEAGTWGGTQAELRAIGRRSLLAHLDIRPRSRRFLDDLSAHSL